VYIIHRPSAETLSPGWSRTISADVFPRTRGGSRQPKGLPPFHVTNPSSAKFQAQEASPGSSAAVRAATGLPRFVITMRSPACARRRYRFRLFFRAFYSHTRHYCTVLACGYNSVRSGATLEWPCDSDRSSILLGSSSRLRAEVPGTRGAAPCMIMVVRLNFPGLRSCEKIGSVARVIRPVPGAQS
jgi:hypothetical protein